MKKQDDKNRIADLVHRLIHQDAFREVFQKDDKFSKKDQEMIDKLVLYGFAYYDPTTGRYRISNIVPTTDGHVTFARHDEIAEVAQRVLDGPLPQIVPYNRHISAWGDYPVYSGANSGRMNVFTIPRMVLPLPPDAENCLRSTGVAVVYVKSLKKHLLFTRQGIGKDEWVIFELQGLRCK